MDGLSVLFPLAPSVANPSVSHHAIMYFTYTHDSYCMTSLGGCVGSRGFPVGFWKQDMPIFAFAPTLGHRRLPQVIWPTIIYIQ